MRTRDVESASTLKSEHNSYLLRRFRTVNQNKNKTIADAHAAPCTHFVQIFTQQHINTVCQNTPNTITQFSVPKWRVKVFEKPYQGTKELYDGSYQERTAKTT